MLTLKLKDPKALTTALAVLRAGGLVLYPTETVYGALVEATNPQAVAKLLAYKRRPRGKAIAIACADQTMAEQYVELNDQAREIYQTFLPGPVTVISRSCGRVVPDLESELKTLGVRLPAYPSLLNLIKKLGRPVTATSANSHGQKTPYTIADVTERLSKKQLGLIDLIIDAGRLPKNPPSLVLDTTTATPVVVRDNPQVAPKLRATPTHYLVHNLGQTYALAQKIIQDNLAAIKATGLVIALDGPLGAGKTTFTAGLATALGIKDPVTSPTYTYLKEYPFSHAGTRGTLYHLDAWTLDQPAMLAALRVEELSAPGNMLVIEWYQNLAAFFQPPTPLVHLTFKPVVGQDSAREIDSICQI